MLPIDIDICAFYSIFSHFAADLVVRQFLLEDLISTTLQYPGILATLQACMGGCGGFKTSGNFPFLLNSLMDIIVIDKSSIKNTSST